MKNSLRCYIYKLCLTSGLSLASLYCNHATREAFYQLFFEFADAVRRVTGKELQIKCFREGGNLRAIILDGEVAQAQGLADWLFKYNKPHLMGIDVAEPLDLLLYILKVCSVHFER